MKDIVKYLPEKEENWKLFRIIFKSFLATKKVMKEYRLSKAAFDSIILLLKEKMLGALINPGEMVGIIGAQTLGEISTQLTLNSVTYETEIIVRDSNKKITKHQIGEFIEKEIRRSNKIDYMEDKDTTYAECNDYLEIPSCDEDGNVTWKRIEAVTKHPVINKDGTNTMLKITTEDEREITVTKAKSLLKLVNGKIIPIDGESIKVGDYLPVSTKQIDFDETFKLDMKCVLPPNEYVYGSELEKAKSVMDEHHWWLKHSNKTFTLPHKRSDTVVQLASNRVRPGRKCKSTIVDGFVYMLVSCRCEYRIPEIIDLNYNFGYLIGAYAAEGCMTTHQISIANNDINYFEPILQLCKEWNITTKIYKKENKNKEGWTSQDLRIYNTILCIILEKFCGKLSHNKFISDKIIYSNKECLKGFLDAYIGGDGHVGRGLISMSSVSKPMLIDVQNILISFDIFSYIHKPPKQETNNRGSLDIKQIYILKVSGRESKKLATILDMKIEYKKEAVNKLLKHNHEFEYAKKFEKIPNEINGEIIIEEREGRFIDTVFSKIKSIDEVPNTTTHAYDLTVEETRNFNINNSLCLRDTFHAAGVGAGSLVITQGIPRLREIINVSKNLKSKNMVIYLKEEYARNKTEARKIQSRFSYTQLKDILAKTEILYDNKYGNTDKLEDREFIKSYKEFAELFDIDNIDESCLSPWILRLTFDKESLMNRKITVQEIQETIKQKFHNDQEIDCIYSDDSVNDVIMRIRIKQDGKGNFLDFIKEFEKQIICLSLRGITNIKQAEITESNIIKYNNDGAMEPTKEWIIKTDGSNILDVMSDDAVDIKRTITNDILEFYEVFGIEATRELIYRELYAVYAEKHPNPRHIQMMADIMTYRGSKIMQIDRHGINKNSEIGPIGKACFEEVMNVFTKAAVFAEKDNMKGVSANILAGQFCKSGTNAFDIFIDEDKLLEEVNVSNYEDSVYVDINQSDVDQAFNSAYKTFEKDHNIDDKDFTFGFGMEQEKEFILNENIDNRDTNIVLVEKNNIILSNNKEESKESLFDNIDIEPVQNYEKTEQIKETTEVNKNTQNIDFESIGVEEPEYNKVNVEQENKPVEKKIRIKKVKEVIPEEKKPIKLKIVKKK
jgi:DNA-directed RNA polymerase beta' subunit